MDTGTPLKRILEAEGRHQRWLARVTGIHESKISLIANRGLHPTQDEALRIADALGRQIDELWPESNGDEEAA